MKLRALELFCGIGGFAAAVAGWNVEVVSAFGIRKAAKSITPPAKPAEPTAPAESSAS